MANIDNCEKIINMRRSSSSLWSDCQPNIQRRINALLNYQAEYFRLRVEFHRQLQDLQYAYNPQFERILECRRAIINGSLEPMELEKQINEPNSSNQLLDLDLIQSILKKNEQISTKTISNISTGT